MTGRTHDLAAFTALTYVMVAEPLIHMTLATAVVAFSANMIGGLAPDIDQPTADLWRRLPAGRTYSWLFTPLLGGHRFISHSILGLIIFGVGVHYLLQMMSSFLLVDMRLVWWAFMIGFASHLIMDFITREGEPILLPIPAKLGFPPFKSMRMKTGGFWEKCVVFPLLLLATAYLFWSHYGKFLDFIKHYIK